MDFKYRTGENDSYPLHPLRHSERSGAVSRTLGETGLRKKRELSEHRGR